MKLSEQDAKLFFQLMGALQSYVNQQSKIHDLECIDDYSDLSTEEKMPVREALYNNINLIDSFVQENPQNLSAENLAIVSGWKKFIRGNFFIERLLKKHAVFIQEENVYAVLALFQSFDDFAHHSNLPLSIEAVLLPFKGKIVYDGLLGIQNIYFGGGIKRRLKETYMRAKQNNRIVVSLEDPNNENQKNPDARPLKNWKPELDTLARKAKKLRGSATSPAIYSPAFSLVKASIEFAQLAVSDASDQESLDKALNKVRRAYNKSNTVLYRQEF